MEVIAVLSAVLAIFMVGPIVMSLLSGWKRECKAYSLIALALYLNGVVLMIIANM